MSRIHEALMAAQRQSLERQMPSSARQDYDEPIDGFSDSRRITPPLDIASFREARSRTTTELPGKVGLSRKKLRNYLLLAFFAAGLILEGTNYALRADGSAWTNGNQLYGVAFEGTVHPASEIRITADSLGTVSDIPVKVGDTVQKGQQLLLMDDRDAQMALKQAIVGREAAAANLEKFRARLAEANARVAVSQRQEQQVPSRQWRDSPERAQAAYDQALTNYNRSHQLHEAGVIAQQELEARATDLRMAQDDLENAKKLAGVSAKLQQDQSEQADLEAKVTRQELQDQMRQADLKYQEAKQHMDETVVRATQAGVVSEIPVRLGDRVPGGTILAKLAELKRMIAEVPVAAPMISELQVGQPVVVSLPSNPPRQVEGRIRTISPLPSANMTHSVEVEFDNPTLLLLAGQPAEVRFSKP